MSQSTLDAFYGRNAAEDERREAEDAGREGGEAQPSPETSNSQLKVKVTRRVIRKLDGTIYENIEALGRPRIIIHGQSGVKIVEELIKCPIKDCNVYFATDYDLQCHLETHRKPLKNGGGEWIPSETLPDMKRTLLNAEFIVKGRYEYKLASEDKIIIRRPRTIS